MLSRRAAIKTAVTGAAMVWAGKASALDYPTRPVRFLVG